MHLVHVVQVLVPVSVQEKIFIKFNCAGVIEVRKDVFVNLKCDALGMTPG